MLEAARKIATKVTLLNSTDGTFLGYNPKVVAGGKGMSGPTFVDNADYREYVFDEFGASCLDMETAAAAHIAYQHGVPFLFFRSLSDLAGGELDGSVLQVFFSIAAQNAFIVLSAFIAELYPDPDGTPGTDVAPTTAPEDSAARACGGIMAAVAGVIVPFLFL